LPPETLSGLRDDGVTRDLDARISSTGNPGELALFASCLERRPLDRRGSVPAQDRMGVPPRYRDIGAFLLRGITPAQMGCRLAGQVARLASGFTESARAIAESHQAPTD